MAQAKKKRATSARKRKPAAKTAARKSAPRKSAGKSTGRSTAGKSANRSRVGGASSAAADTLIDATRSRAFEQFAGLARELCGIGCIVLSVIILLALTTFDANDPGWSHTGLNSNISNSVGLGGAWLADVLFYLFGFVAYVVPAVLAYTGWRLFRPKRARTLNEPFVFVRLLGIVLMLVSACGLADLHFGVTEGALPDSTFGGGILGTEIAWKLVSIFKPLGTTLLLIALLFCSLTLSLGSTWSGMLDSIGGAAIGLSRRVSSFLHGAVDGVGALQKRRELERARQIYLEEARVGHSALDDDPLLDPFDGTEAELFDKPADMSGFRAEIAKAKANAKGKAGDKATDDATDNTSRTAADDELSLLDKTIALGRNQLASKSAQKSAPKSAQTSKAEKSVSESNALAKLQAAAKRPDADAQSSSDDDHPVLTNPVLKPIRKATDAGSVTAKVAAAAGASAAAAATAAAAPRKAQKKKLAIGSRKTDEHQYPLFRDVPDSDLPPLSLLDPPQRHKAGYTDEELEALSRLLEVKLADFNISVEVVAVHPGPVITRFELQPEPGTKAKQITNLTQDIARSLSLVSVRVVEVIAGKSTIGLEIPNEERELIQLSELLQSREYDAAKSPLTLALGKNISGTPVTADLAGMPHLLVAGTTGSGKSVAVNAMLLSLLYKATAQEVRLILVDPKMLELNIYDGIPHLLTPVVTDMKEAANALRWCVGEMERRYKVMASLGVRNLAGYNKKVREAIKAGSPLPDPLYNQQTAINPGDPPPTLEPFPVIVVVVDEFADMMMQVGKKAEELIARIAQKARAAGIHLILATQRPSVDVITGLIKANIPTRIAFQVSSRVDSRTILDQMGAESLLGHGDMLYLPAGVGIPERVHGAFVDDHEVHAVVANLKSSGEPNYIEEIVQEVGALPGIPADSEDMAGEQDELYDQAVAVVTESRRASISYVQRRLKIGYNRSARIVEDMEAAGVVSQVQSNGNREVLAPPPIAID